MSTPGAAIQKAPPRELAPRTELSETARLQIRALEVARARAASALERVEDEARRATDWRTLVRRHPWAAVGATFAAGYLLGRLFRRR